MWNVIEYTNGRPIICEYMYIKCIKPWGTWGELESMHVKANLLRKALVKLVGGMRLAKGSGGHHIKQYAISIAICAWLSSYNILCNPNPCR